MEKKPHLLVISQCFYPEPFRINDMAAEWVRRGYRVTVVTGIPTYPEGRFYPGYSLSRKRRDVYEGAEVIRLPIFPRGRSSAGLVLNYLSFVVSGWFFKTFSRVRADLVFSFEGSPMTQVKVGCWYAKKHRVPHFLYVQDLWPENVEFITGIHSRLVIGPIDRMVDRIYRQTDRILVTSPAFREAVIGRKHPVPPEKVFYWPQYAEDFYRPAEKRPVPEIPEDGTFKVIFTGVVGYAQGLEVLPETARLLKGEAVRFVVVGGGRYLDEFGKELEKQGVKEMFTLIPRQPPERIPALLACCDAGFISFKKTPLFEKTIPAKLQSYMACAVPVLASAGGETERVIREAGCGMVSPTGDARALARNLLEMKASPARLEQMGARGRAYFERHFARKERMDQMDRWIAESLARRG